MGKDLKGKNLGDGISQRKDGKYTARFTSINKKRIEKHFDKISEAKKWLLDAKYEDAHGNIGASSQITVDAWFQFWITNIKEKTTKYNTVRHYNDRYRCAIQDTIGNMVISDVKPMHCQNVLNLMKDKYKSSTIQQTKVTMTAMFSYAVQNQIISSSPVTKSVVVPKSGEKKIRFLSLEEQCKFLEVAKGTKDYYQFLLILNTGLRTGEMMGLRWCDVDFKKRTINVNQTLVFHYDCNEFIPGKPKSKSSCRTIPMTDIAYNILKIKHKEWQEKKIYNPQFKDYVFLNKKGLPRSNLAYNCALRVLAKKAGIDSLSMHTLRHTFATRAIESGMQYKTLQIILGHSSLSMTMDIYAHITDDEKEKAMKIFENVVAFE